MGSGGFCVLCVGPKHTTLNSRHASIATRLHSLMSFARNRSAFR